MIKKEERLNASLPYLFTYSLRINDLASSTI